MISARVMCWSFRAPDPDVSGLFQKETLYSMVIANEVKQSQGIATVAVAPSR